MKLVACHACHAQYDVSHVGAKEFACRCGETVANRDLRAVDAEIHRCGSCGAIVAANAQRCDYCTSAIVHDPRRLGLICPECCARNPEDCRFCTACGVAFAPQPLPDMSQSELPCPCCGCLMPVRALDGIALHECAICHGVWAPGDHFERLVQRAIDTRKQRAVQGEHRAPRMSGANPKIDVRYRKCPVCEAFMHRVNFRRRSGVILDECRKHGTWLDADELEQIAGFILSGGLAEAQVLAEAEYTAAQKREAALVAHVPDALGRALGRALDRETGRAGRGSAPESNGLLRTVMELFEVMLS
jgi:Zn-finger nucleic acid-binding protein